MNFFNFLKTLEYPEYSESIESYRDDRDPIFLDLSLHDTGDCRESLERVLSSKGNEIGKYTLTQYKPLIEEISKYHNVSSERIIITSGGDHGLSLCSRVFIDKDTAVLIPLPSFGRYEYHAKTNLGKINFIQPDNFPFDIRIDRIIEEGKGLKKSILFLANPNNPTGIFKSIDQIEYLLENYSGLVVLDEVLCDSVGEGAVKLVDKFEKLIVIRSFSKFFNLAGMRVGYLIASQEIVSTLRKLVSPYEVSGLSLFLATDILQNRKSFIDSKRSELLKSLKSVWTASGKGSVQFSPSQSSVCVGLLHSDKNFFQELYSQGILTVSGKDFRGLENSNAVRFILKNHSTTLKLLDLMRSL